jgi:hypothetical protein
MFKFINVMCNNVLEQNGLARYCKPPKEEKAGKKVKRKVCETKEQTGNLPSFSCKKEK